MHCKPANRRLLYVRFFDVIHTLRLLPAGDQIDSPDSGNAAQRQKGCRPSTGPPKRNPTSIIWGFLRALRLVEMTFSGRSHNINTVGNTAFLSNRPICTTDIIHYYLFFVRYSLLLCTTETLNSQL